MAEEINKTLDEHSRIPECSPYVCIRAGVLQEIVENLRKADYETVVAVYKHAIKLNLPQSFKDELKFECRKRGYNTS